MTFDIYTYGAGEAVYEAFNAIAAIMGGGDYIVLVKIFMVLALFWVVIEMGFHQTINWHVFIMFGLMFNIFFVPKETMVIHDRFNPAATRIVANVPFGLAGPAWLVNTISDKLTRLVEAGFSQPNDLKYSKTGMVFGSKLMTSINNARFDDPLLNQNLVMYAKQCIYLNIAFHFYSVSDIYKSNNLVNLLLSTTNNSSIRGMFYDNGGSSLYLTCKQAAGQLRTDITPVVDTMLGRFGNMFFSSSGQSTATNKARLMAALPAAYGYMAAIATTAQAQLTQAAMANYFENSYGDVASMMGNAGAATAWATAVAERQQRSAYRTSGNIAAKYLPLFQSTFRVIIYASFIAVFLALMMPTTIAGAALKLFIQVLLWIEYWPILYAFINMVVTVYAKGITHYSIDPSMGITSMANMHGMSVVNSNISIIAGYLALSVPVFAWIMASKSAQALASISTGLFTPATQAANQVGGEISRGNISTGNLSAGNESIMQQQTAPNMNLGGSFDTGKVKQTITPDGQDVIEVGQDNLGVNFNAHQRLEHQTTQALNSSKANETVRSAQVSSATSDQNTALHSAAHTAATNDNFNVSKETRHDIGGGDHYQSLQEKVATNDVTHNMSKEDQAKLTSYIDAHAGIDSDKSLFGKIMSGAAGVSMGVDTGLKGEASGTRTDTDSTQDANAERAAHSFIRAAKDDHDLIKSASEVKQGSEGYQEAHQLTQAHSKVVTSTQAYQQAHKETEALQKTDTYTKANGKELSANLNGYLTTYLRDIKPTPAGSLDPGELLGVASSNKFLSYAEGRLNDAGVHIDLDGDGAYIGWAAGIAKGNDPTTEDAPSSITQAPTDNVPTTNPVAPIKKEVHSQLETAEERANDNKVKIARGKNETQPTHIKKNPDNRRESDGGTGRMEIPPMPD